jgi:hypothetical protein
MITPHHVASFADAGYAAYANMILSAGSFFHYPHSDKRCNGKVYLFPNVPLTVLVGYFIASAGLYVTQVTVACNPYTQVLRDQCRLTCAQARNRLIHKSIALHSGPPPNRHSCASRIIIAHSPTLTLVSLESSSHHDHIHMTHTYPPLSLRSGPTMNIRYDLVCHYRRIIVLRTPTET